MPAGSDRLEVVPVELEEVRQDWDELAVAASSPFASVEWFEAWLEHGGVDCTPRLFAGRRSDGTVAAVLPLVLVRGRFVTKLRFAGFGVANALGPVCRPADRDAAGAALRTAAERTRAEWGLFLAETLPGPGWATRLGAAPVSRESSPVVRGAWASWDDYLATRSPNFRSELRRQERKLAARGLAVRTVTGLEELGQALDRLFQLHRERWSDAASMWFAGREAFHRAFAAAALARGWLRLHVLELEGRVAAVYLGYRCGETAWYYQLGRETADRAASLGVVIVAHAFRESLAEGVCELNLGPGAQRYKLRLATGDAGVETVAIARGIRGRAALLAARRRGG